MNIIYIQSCLRRIKQNKHFQELFSTFVFLQLSSSSGVSLNSKVSHLDNNSKTYQSSGVSMNSKVSHLDNYSETYRRRRQTCPDPISVTPNIAFCLPKVKMYGHEQRSVIIDPHSIRQKHWEKRVSAPQLVEVWVP